MSAANKALREKPMIGHLAVLGVTLIGVFTTYALDRNTAESDLINSKADVDRVEKLEYKMSNVATFDYVDKRIQEHALHEKELMKEVMTPMQDDIKMIKDFILYNKLPDKTN